jgi:hypothetical protein
MDVRIEAVSMTADVEMTKAIVRAIVQWFTKALTRVALVASFSCPTLGSHSLSAVAPDNYFGKELAAAV